MSTVKPQQRTAAERLYFDAKKYAMARAGGEGAFWVIGSTFRTAMVAQAILQTLYQQDESLSDVRVRELLSDMYELLTNDTTLEV